MELTLLTVPACPNAAALEERLAAALAGHPDTVLHRREITDEREAAQAGMHGSPTLLIDGVDPFAPRRASHRACPAGSTRTRPGGPKERPRGGAVAGTGTRQRARLTSGRPGSQDRPADRARPPAR